ncbi:uncharacterized protein UDID_18702 [Ustilago sp. UG-2017a]|nr:uncharacterized protein UDID_18702 [Ustilago sp. UG-2017a]
MESNPEEETNQEDNNPTEEEPHDPYSADHDGLDLAQLFLTNDPEKDCEEDEEGNLIGTVQDHPAHILADTSTSLSIVSDSFICKYQLKTKPTKTRSIHSVNSSTTVQVVIGDQKLGGVEASIANTADYDLILGFLELRRLRPTIWWDTSQLEFKTQGQEAHSKNLRQKPLEPTKRDPPNKDYNSVKLHGHEFVSVEHLIRAALEDGPIGFMLLDVPPLSLPLFGFVPTGNDRGVEMEVEPDKLVTIKDIPEPYQHLQEVFNEVEADKLPPHTEHSLRLELSKGSKPPQGLLYLKGPKEMAELHKYLDKNLAKGFIQLSKSPAQSPVLFVPKKDGGL